MPRRFPKEHVEFWNAYLKLMKERDDIATELSKEERYIMKFSTGGGGDFAPYEAGSHIGRIVWVVDIGLQDSPWKEEGVHKVLIGYASPDVMRDDGAGPVVLTERLTASMNAKAKLRQRVQQITGTSLNDKQAEDFDVASLAGMPVQYSVTHSESEKTGRTYANISSCMPPPKKVKVDELETHVVDVGQDDKLKELPEWIGDLALTGWARLTPAKSDDDFDDDLPF